jgi:hypothetical protein
VRIAGASGVLLLCCTLGCIDPATVGGLCSSAGACNGAMHPSAPDAEPADSGPADSGPIDADTMEDADSTCGTSSPMQLTRKQLDLILVIDDTASLVPWLPALQDGLSRLFQAEEWRGIGLGLQRFDEVCDPQFYAELIVPIAPLPENASALQAAIENIPTLTTSTAPALAGVLQHARAWAASRAETEVAIVLLTDASPGACDGLTGNIEAAAQQVAREGLESTPSIKTHVVGFGMVDPVTALAHAGGTEPALINLFPADGEVLAALETVRRSAQPCAFMASTQDSRASGTVVMATTPEGAQRSYPIHESSLGCDQEDGFYRGDEAALPPIVACPRVCAGLGGADRLTLEAACGRL